MDMNKIKVQAIETFSYVKSKEIMDFDAFCENSYAKKLVDFLNWELSFAQNFNKEES